MNRANMFKVLEDNEYNGFEDIEPYNKIIDAKWWRLSPHPIGNIINERFSKYYDGKLTWREINLLKDKMVKCQKQLDEFNSKSYNNRRELKETIKKEKQLCNDECSKELQKHIDMCNSTYKCHGDYVAYECRFKDNGRCSHYYDIKHCEERLEDYDYVVDEYTDYYIDYQVEYERTLAIKENRYEEYKRKNEEYFD